MESLLDIFILQAWQLVYQARNTNFSENYRRDMAILQQVKNMLANTTIMNRLGGNAGLTDILQKNYTAPCYTCNNTNTERSHMNDYLKHVGYFAERYGNIPSATNVIGGQGMKSTSLWQVYGTAHMIRFMHDDQANTFVPTDFEKDYTNPNPFPDCRVDAQIGIDADKIVCEFKSWSTKDNVQNEEGLFDPGNSTSFENWKSMFWNFGLGYASTSQFRCYLQQISAIDKLRYYFDAKRAGVTEDHVKNTFKQMMYNKATEELTPNGQLVFDAIWGNTRGLKVDLFPRSNYPASLTESEYQDAAKNDFISFNKNLDNRFFKFINVK